VLNPLHSMNRYCTQFVPATMRLTFCCVTLILFNKHQRQPVISFKLISGFLLPTGSIGIQNVCLFGLKKIGGACGAARTFFASSSKPVKNSNIVRKMMSRQRRVSTYHKETGTHPLIGAFVKRSSVVRAIPVSFRMGCISLPENSP